MDTNGEIVKIMRNRGFGFINSNNQESEIFFHQSNLQNTSFDELKEGSKVKFNLKETPKGLEAVEINIINLDTNVEEQSASSELS